MLADFTDAGLYLVEKVHNSEGFHHDRVAHPPGDATRRLKDMGFSVETKFGEFQYVLIASKPYE